MVHCISARYTLISKNEEGKQNWINADMKINFAISARASPLKIIGLIFLLSFFSTRHGTFKSILQLCEDCLSAEIVTFHKGEMGFFNHERLLLCGMAYEMLLLEQSSKGRLNLSKKFFFFCFFLFCLPQYLTSELHYVLFSWNSSGAVERPPWPSEWVSIHCHFLTER